MDRAAAFPPEGALLAFVESGDDATAQSLLSTLPVVVASRSKARVLLSAADVSRRLLGLANLCTELAYAVDPVAARVLVGRVEPLVAAVAVKASGPTRAFKDRICLTLSAAAARAALQTGDFEQALAITEGALGTSAVDDATRELRSWLDDIRYECFVRRLAFIEAVAMKAKRVTAEPSWTSRVKELDAMLDDFLPVASERVMLEPLVPFVWSSEIKRLVAEWIGRQRLADDHLKRSFAGLGLPRDLMASTDEGFMTAADALDQIERRVLGSTADDEAHDTLHREHSRHAAAIRGLLGFDSDRATTLDDNRDRVNRAAMVIGLRRPTDDELRQALSAFSASAEWSASVGDLHGNIMAVWAKGRTCEMLGMDGSAISAYSGVLRHLAAIRARHSSTLSRSLLSGTFRTLVPRLAALAVSHGAHELAFDALEFRRGLAIVDMAPGTAPTDALDDGPSVPYFAVSVLPENGVFAVLRTPDGVCRAERVDLEPARLDVLVMRVDPDTWMQPLSRRVASPRRELAPILNLLDHALGSGAIRRGDHVVLALDHPVQAVPVHYLELRGMLALEHLTFSRVASFQDLRQIVRSRPVDVSTAAALHIPARDMADGRSHTSAFSRSIKPLHQCLDGVSVMVGSEVDRQAVLSTLAGYDLVHVQAHGYFPATLPATVVDVVREAGFLVADDGRLPSRSEPRDYLFGAVDVIDSAFRVPRHVSLSACVSGLGRPGRAGDMLGLEFALRLRGTETVLASVWDVEVGLAADFYTDYYRNWLVAGGTRAEAWQKAVLQRIEASDGSLEARCAACAFILFGDWR